MGSAVSQCNVMKMSITDDLASGFGTHTHTQHRIQVALVRRLAEIKSNVIQLITAHAFPHFVSSQIDCVRNKMIVKQK